MASSLWGLTIHFHFNLRNLPPLHRHGTQDIIGEMKAGLEDCGHFVSLDDQDFFAAPVINLIFENFTEETVPSLRAFKQEAGDGLIFGVICGEDLLDPLIMDGEFSWRRDAMMQAAEIADFVWTLIPNVEEYGRFTDADKVFWFELGYSDRIRTIQRAPHCDIDVFMPGNLYPYRETAVNALTARGLKVRSSNYQMPINVYQSIAGRSKVILDIGRDKGLRFLSSTRIILGVNNEIVVVSEKFDQSPLKFFYDYTVAAKSDDLVDLCEQTVRDPSVIELGQAMTKRFQVDHPVGPKVMRLLENPNFLKLVHG